MTMPNRTRSPKAMKLMSAGMMCLVLAIVFQQFVHPNAGFGLNLLHGLCGMFFGMSVSLNVGAAILAGRQRRCQAS